MDLSGFYDNIRVLFTSVGLFRAIRANLSWERKSKNPAAAQLAAHQTTTIAKHGLCVHKAVLIFK